MWRSATLAANSLAGQLLSTRTPPLDTFYFNQELGLRVADAAAVRLISSLREGSSWSSREDKNPLGGCLLPSGIDGSMNAAPEDASLSAHRLLKASKAFTHNLS